MIPVECKKRDETLKTSRELEGKVTRRNVEIRKPSVR